jgi:hypothetical protein
MRFHSIFSLIDFVRIQPWGHVAGNRTPQAATSVYFCLSPLGILRHGISSSVAPEEYRPHTQDGSLRLDSAAGLGTNTSSDMAPIAWKMSCRKAWTLCKAVPLPDQARD